jgi:hypothetical protein
MDNPEKLATLGTDDTRRRQTKQNTQPNMCWTTLCKENTDNVIKTLVYKQLEVETNRTSKVFFYVYIF